MNNVTLSEWFRSESRSAAVVCLALTMPGACAELPRLLVDLIVAPGDKLKLPWNWWKLRTSIGALCRTCSWSVVLLLVMAAGCARTNIQGTPVTQKIGSLEVATLSIDERIVAVTLDDLQRIQDVLLQWLDERSGNPDLDQLRQVTRTEKCFITHDGVARIGAWTLKARSGRPVLERTVPRSPGTTVVPVAALAEEDGNWEVLDVSAVVVRGR